MTISKLVPKSWHFWITFAIGVTFAYFMWLTWQKLTIWIGDSNIVWIITGVIVLVALLTGFISFKKVAEKFN